MAQVNRKIWRTRVAERDLVSEEVEALRYYQHLLEEKNVSNT